MPPFELSLDYLKALSSQFVVPFAINLAIAIAIFYIGRIVARIIKKALGKVLTRSKFDESLTKFICDLVYALLMMVIIIAALERLGVKTTAAIAIIGAMGLAVGLALQGSLGNFAAGVMILLFKPYKLGDLVTLGDHTGVVQEIKIFVTTIHSPQNQEIIIPNGQAIAGAVVNFSTTEHLRVDLVIGIGYGEDIRKAKQVMTDAVNSVPGVLKDPAPTIAVTELADNSVNFVVRPHATVADYWDVYFGTLEACKIALDDAGIEIPFPQRDLHLKDIDGAAPRVCSQRSRLVSTRTD